MNFKSTTGWLILCAIAGGSFVTFAHAEEPKVESTPQSIRSERTHFAPPIRVILPALWEQKASSSTCGNTDRRTPAVKAFWRLRARDIRRQNGEQGPINKHDRHNSIVWRRNTFSRYPSRGGPRLGAAWPRTRRSGYRWPRSSISIEKRWSVISHPTNQSVRRS